MGRPKLRGKKTAGWQTIVDPQFVEAAYETKKALKAGAEQNAVAHSEHVARLDTFLKRYSTRLVGHGHAFDLIFATVGKWPDHAKWEGEAMLSWLHWNRFRMPLWQDGMKAKCGDIPASKRLNQTSADYDEWRSDSNWHPSFKINLDHSGLFETGLKLGLEDLTEEQLAECFDALCPCAEETHSADALRKQRARLKNDLDAAAKWEAEQAPKLVRQMADKMAR